MKIKISSILPVLSTLLLLTTADPIPSDARSVVRALKGGAEAVGDAVGHLAKRIGGLENKLFGDDENGPRYWAWSKLAYDKNWNEVEGPRQLEGGQNTKWALLMKGESNILVKGYASPVIDSPWGGGWTTYTGMKVVVGLDQTFKTIVMAFVGSEGLVTAKTDLKFFQTQDMDSRIPGNLETGFYEAYRSVQVHAFQWAKEWAEANKDYDIVITGHSLGGATAHIAAVGWIAENPQFKERTTVFTYGAPRAGDKTFQDQLHQNQGSRMVNFRHRYDLVTDVPPINFGTGSQFANAGGRAEFNGEGKWSDSASWTFDDNPDTETHRYQSILSLVKDIIHKFDEHTGYFGDVTSKKRAIKALADLWKSSSNNKRDAPNKVLADLWDFPSVGETEESHPEKREEPNKVLADLWNFPNVGENVESHIQKREAPNGDDYHLADGIINRIMQSGQLNPRYPLTLTPELQEFTKLMRITSEQAGLVKYLEDEATEDDRLTYLKTLQVIAMEKE